MDPQLELLLDVATRPYLAAGRHALYSARWKLRLDPVFFALLRHGLFPGCGRLLDLGCGQGILLSLLQAAKGRYQAGAWPPSWPPPPLNLDLNGIDLREDRVRVARRALGDSVPVEACDLRDLDFQPCSVIVMLDVLLYLGAEEQRRVLQKAAEALGSGGLLLLREADAGAGLAFHATRLAERLLEALRGRLRNRLHYRSAAQWAGVLESLGFSVDVEPMSEGTPFANVLFVARKISKAG